MASFDRSRIEDLLRLAGERLDGEWLLIGGAAAAAWFSAARTTEDLDLIGLGGTQAERFALMELAAAAGIPIEAVNSAADFFVRRIPDWRAQLTPLHRGSRATIFRPTATLFLLLKIGRLTETDLSDCLALLEHCRATTEQIDRARIVDAIDALPATRPPREPAGEARVTAAARDQTPFESLSLVRCRNEGNCVVAIRRTQHDEIVR